MKSVLRWSLVTLGLGALWFVTRAVVFYFLGVLTFFVTAFQATVNELSRTFPGETSMERSTPSRPRRLQADIDLREALVDVVDLTHPEVVQLDDEGATTVTA